jgi:hypothetical protein
VKKRKKDEKKESANPDVIEWLRNASTEQIMEISVKAGIYDKDGNLTEFYREGN